MNASKLNAKDLEHATSEPSEVLSATGERRTVLRSTKSSVWYLTQHGRPKQCSMESWLLWRVGKVKRKQGGGPGADGR